VGKPDRRGAKKGVPQTHVRGQMGKPKPGSPPVDYRVSVIFDLMSADKWGKPGSPTAKQLADEWGVSLSSVHAAAAEASRRVKLCTNPEWVRQRLAGALEAELFGAKGKPREVAMVAKVYADITGAGAPQRLEHSGPDGKPMGLQLYPVVALPELESDPAKALPEGPAESRGLPQGAPVDVTVQLPAVEPEDAEKGKGAP
jgi:hypothetical protein